MNLLVGDSSLFCILLGQRTSRQFSTYTVPGASGQGSFRLLRNKLLLYRRGKNSGRKEWYILNRYLDIPVQTVMVANGAEELVGKNPNSEPTPKVQAFVMSFAPTAQWVSRQCYGLPQKFILAHWGAESGWGSTAASQRAQNWASICVPGGKTEQFRVYAGRREFAESYARLLKQGSAYAELRKYLASTELPQTDRCIEIIARSGYSASSSGSYEKLLRDCVASIEKRAGDIFKE